MSWLESAHRPGPYKASETACQACGTPLWREPCECWTDCRGTRWCNDRYNLHRPGDGFGEQPPACRGDW